MLGKTKNKSENAFLKRRDRIRFKLKKDNHKPRLSIFISNMHIYAQIIDDMKGITLVSASTKDKTLKDVVTKTSNVEAANIVGKEIAIRALKVGVAEIVFDRGGNLYHGKVKSLADSARSNGLKF